MTDHRDRKRPERVSRGPLAATYTGAPVPHPLKKVVGDGKVSRDATNRHVLETSPKDCLAYEIARL